MVLYEYFPPKGERGRRSRVLPDDVACAMLGDRVLNGWDVVQRSTTDRNGGVVVIAALVSFDGRVWALYVG